MNVQQNDIVDKALLKALGTTFKINVSYINVPKEDAVRNILLSVVNYYKLAICGNLKITVDKFNYTYLIQSSNKTLLNGIDKAFRSYSHSSISVMSEYTLIISINSNGSIAKHCEDSHMLTKRLHDRNEVAKLKKLHNTPEYIAIQKTNRRVTFMTRILDLTIAMYETNVPKVPITINVEEHSATLEFDSIDDIPLFLTKLESSTRNSNKECMSNITMKIDNAILKITVI